MGEVKLLARLLKWLKRLEDTAPGLLGRGGGLKFAVEMGGGLLLGGLTVLLLFVVVLKFGVRMFGQFVTHDTFPAVVTTVMFVVPIVVACAAASTVPVHPLWASLGALTPTMAGAIAIHPQAVKIRDNARKNDLPADTPTEAPPPTDVGCLPE